jgi:hypothetical protein
MAHSEDECPDPRCRIILSHPGYPHAYTWEEHETWRLKAIADEEERKNKQIYEEYKKKHGL